MSEIGKLLIILGLVLVGLGALFSAQTYFPWIGRLPGDFWVKRGNLSFYFPFTTCLLASLVLTFLMWLFRR